MILAWGARGRKFDSSNTLSYYILEINKLDRNMVYDITLWHNLIHVANPT